ncbi:MAG: alkane 1-monooxygenase [Bacteroidetes bacterium]|nr:MAG: alkane 1-monooxygenase [Bacteroidota bacterium]REK55246.1 MAG: alkane 1-monooxygenase [Bacteroidota bacterium]
MGKFRYLLVFTLPLLALISFHSFGIWSYLPMLEAFLLIPVLEFLFAPQSRNLDDSSRAAVNTDVFYIWALRITVPVQVFCGVYMLVQISMPLDTVTLIGRILSYGIMCGVVGINVAHELGHKSNAVDQFLAKVLLTSTLYTHFFLEHNFGHHKNVGTPNDPTTARRGEWVYAYWFRSILFSYLSAWRIGIQRSKGNILKNEMIYYTIVQLALLLLLYSNFGSIGLLGFCAASITGWILLETVQYIEHYGLTRNKINEHRYENVQPHHSWNSDHIWGRAILFELSRHSDHHYLPNKAYPLLDHHDESPQLPTGYPGMMLLSLIPPLFMKIVHPRIPNVESIA